MKMNEFQRQMQVVVDELFPDLLAIVRESGRQLTAQVCVVDLTPDFAVERMEWINNTIKRQRSLIKSRMYDMLRTHKEYIEELMVRCK